MLSFTDHAIEVLHRAHDAAVRLNPGVRLRLTAGPAGLQTALTETAGPEEHTLEVDGIALVVADDLAGLVDVEPPHDRLVLRETGAPPGARS